MQNKISTIGIPLIDNFSRIIRRLAKSGRNHFFDYFIHPLSQWRGTPSENSLEHYINIIKETKLRKQFTELPQLYKSAIIKSTAPEQFDLQKPGNISLDFLKIMKYEKTISKSTEALEFVNLLKSPFKNFSDIEFDRMNKKFASEISKQPESDVEQLIKIQQGNIETKSDYDENLSREYQKLCLMFNGKKVHTLRKPIINFLISQSNPENPNGHLIVDELFDKIHETSNNFKKDVFDTIAIMIYHEIMKSIKENNLRTAVRYISKYAILFRGNPKTPYFNEVDTFEKLFFQILEKRNLWDKL